jgi:nucleotide-binding universal stress UspA family protein
MAQRPGTRQALAAIMAYGPVFPAKGPWAARSYPATLEVRLVAAACRQPIRRRQAMPGITVGIDGSDHSVKALEWAMKEAATQHSPVTVITVHLVPMSGWTGNPIILPADTDVLEQARQAAEELTGKVTSQLGDARPTSVKVRAVNGFPAQELIEASRDADLIVVGSRGGGGFARLTMGSVSSQVVHHAHCPVVVVR